MTFPWRNNKASDPRAILLGAPKGSLEMGLLKLHARPRDGSNWATSVSWQQPTWSRVQNLMHFTYRKGNLHIETFSSISPAPAKHFFHIWLLEASSEILPSLARRASSLEAVPAIGWSCFCFYLRNHGVVSLQGDTTQCSRRTLSFAIVSEV